MIGKPKPSDLKTWVVWFGELRISEVQKKDVMDFGKNFKDKFIDVEMSLKREYAVVDALRVCIARAKLKVFGYRDVKRWGETCFPKLVATKDKLFKPKPGSEFPANIINEMKKLKGETNDISDDEEEDGVADSLPEKRVTKPQITKNLCIACNEIKGEKLLEHPLFEGLICHECKTFCPICGDAEDTLYVCSEVNCGRKYCCSCIRRYLDCETRRQIKQWLPWRCFLCDEHICNSLQVRSNWTQNLVYFFNPDSLQYKCKTIRHTGERIRILSLFDGIGSVKQALMELNLDIDLYVAMEPNPAARAVIIKNKGNVNVHVVDNIKTLMIKEEVEKLCPIDLVIANPPDDEFDIQEEKDDNRSAVMISNVSSIIKLVRKYSQQRKVYWMIESTAHMPSDWRVFLDTLLEKKSYFWDAQFVSPYMYPRIYWGNIPGLDRYKQVCKRRDVPTLKSFLDDDRQAKVKVLRSCAFDTSSKSQESTDYRTCMKINNYKLPVIEDWKERCVRVEECEQILGFPDDYTFVPTNSLQQRQALLKKGSSVIILKEILMPISKYFVSTNRKRIRLH
ncbi:DNA (cytosine-5)-methyltransferase 3A [Mactra antiquata]